MRKICVEYGALATMLVAAAGMAATTPPLPPLRADVEAALIRNMPASGSEKPLRIVLLADRKDHDPGEHDYPLWQERWALLLGGRAASQAKQVNLYGPPDEDRQTFEGAANVAVERAWGWPSDAQFASCDLIVAFCYLQWTAQRKKQLAGYLERGGGLVLIHSSTWTKPEADPEVAALVGIGGFTRYRHGEVRVEVAAPEHPICRGLPQTLVLHDEPYWSPTPSVDTNHIIVLAVSHEKTDPEDSQKEPQPLFWSYSVGEGRIFGCVLGHYMWTFDDPWFRLWLLRGIAWASGDPPYRLDGLALRGARVRNLQLHPIIEE